jgi:hypothetical protein
MSFLESGVVSSYCEEFDGVKISFPELRPEECFPNA